LPRKTKIGHTGTLDPFATGLLIVCIGEATKISSFFLNDSKTYRATLELGNETNTGDFTGEITKTKEAVSITESQIKAVLNAFLGKQKQVPPMFSAKKINGIPLYKMARKNETIERKAEDINIKSISLVEFSDNKITFDVECSKGTYVRVIGSDIAEKLNTYGNLTALSRKTIGYAKIQNSTKLENLEQKDEITAKDLFSLQQVFNEFLPRWTKITLEESAEKLFRDGMPIPTNNISYMPEKLIDDCLIYVCNSTSVFGLAKIKNGLLNPTKVFPTIH
jgi:tRNA pseudouridine55 synthase